MNNTTPLRIGFIFEGATDEETIPVLVAKLLQRPVDSIPVHKQTGGFDDFRRCKQPDDSESAPELARRWGKFKSYVIALLIKEVDAIIVLVDNDSNDPAYKRWCLLGRNLPFDGHRIQLIDVSDMAEHCDQVHLTLSIRERHIAQVRQPGTTPVIIGVAVEMLEAWLLAQPHVVESVLWEEIPPEKRAQCNHPEQITHPKNEMIRPHNGGGGLSQKQAREIGEHPDFFPEPIEAVCPSFARFAQGVRTLIPSANSSLSD